MKIDNMKQYEILNIWCNMRFEYMIQYENRQYEAIWDFEYMNKDMYMNMDMDMDKNTIYNLVFSTNFLKTSNF